MRSAVLFAAFCCSIGAQTYAPGDSIFLGSAQIDSGGVIGTYGGYANAVSWDSSINESSDVGLRFSAHDLTAVSIVAAQNNTTQPIWILYEDDVQIGTTVVCCTGFPTINFTAAFSAGSHTYRIGQFAGGYTSILVSVILTGGGLTGVKPPVKPIIGYCGDSITEMTGGAFGMLPNDTRGGDPWMASLPLGATDIHPARSGQRVSTYLRDFCPPNLALTPAPKVVWLNGGTIDSANGVAPSIFIADEQRMISNTIAALPSGTPVMVRGILPSNFGYWGANRNTYEGYQRTAQAAVGGSSCFVNTDGWIDPATDTYEGLHPRLGVAGVVDVAGVVATWDSGDDFTLVAAGQTIIIDGKVYTVAAKASATSLTLNASLGALTGVGFTAVVPGTGYAKIANREIPINAAFLAGSSFTVTGGSTSGYAGLRSAAFSVTLAGGATFTGDQTITFGDTPGGGEFCFAGACHSAPYTYMPAEGLGNFRVSYKASSAGTHILTFGSGQDCWRSPPGISYVAASAPVIHLQSHP